MGSSDADKWQEAMCTEILAILGNETYEIVDLPAGAKAIGSGWVFKVKRKADCTVERYKARLVAKGYSQRPGIDYSEIFAPTFRPAALRLIIALAGIEGMELRSVDISSAFTNGDLEEEIYMMQPEGFHQGGPNKVCKLKKSLYGLKQSARQWNKKLHSELANLGFTRLQSDRSIYLYARGELKIILPVYIDDLTFASKDTALIDKAVEDLSKVFKLRDLGETRFLLGIEITRDRKKRTISLSQHQYVVDLLERYGMQDCNPVGTPLPPGIKLSKKMAPQNAEEIAFMREVPYLSAIGSLQYLATMTRPDIQYAVSYLARFNHNPGPQHWAALKHLLRYLQGSKDFKLVYTGSDSALPFSTFSDASHGDCVDSGRSTGAYLAMIGGGAVGWSSKLQTVVALSSTEAEYMAAVEAGKEIMWMRNILGEFGYAVSGPSSLGIDNLSAISVSKNPEHFGRMKHLDLRFFWLRDAVDSGVVAPFHVPGTEQPADALTKPLPLPAVKSTREAMGLQL